MNRLDGYRSPTYDDAVDADGRLRPAAQAAMDAVLAHDLGALGREVRDDLHDRGIRFAAVNGDDSWHVDPIPRVIERGGLGPARDGARAADARAQRVRGRRLRRAADRERGDPSPARARQRRAPGVRAPRLQPARRRVDRARRARHRPRRRGPLARAGGQRPHAERARLLGRRARGHARAPVAPGRGLPAAARRADRHRAAAHVRPRSRGRAHRRRGELRLLGALLDRRAARAPAGRARRPDRARRADLARGRAAWTGSTGVRTPTAWTPRWASCYSRSWSRAGSSWSTASAPASPTTSWRTPTCPT